MNTQINYLYRDASNYKKHQSVVVEGTFTDEQMKAIDKSLSEGLYFIPRQVGLPEERFDEVTEDDHCWFEISIEDFKQTSNEPTELITAKDVYEGFARAGKEGWDVAIYAI